MVSVEVLSEAQGEVYGKHIYVPNEFVRTSLVIPEAPATTAIFLT